MNYPNRLLVLVNMMIDFHWGVRNINIRSSDLGCVENKLFITANNASEKLWFDMMKPEDRDTARFLEQQNDDVRITYK